MTFAAIAAAAALSPLRAQQVPGRDLFEFPLGTLAEAPALASSAGGGFWNPATIVLRGGSALLLSASALNSPPEQGVSAQLGTIAFRLRPGLTGGLSVAQSSVGGLLRTDTDPLSLGTIPYNSLVLSGIVAAQRGATTIGLALRRRSGNVDMTTGHATSIDVGATVDRPGGLPFRAALSSFLLSPSQALERASGLAALEAFLPVTKNDLRAGLSYQRSQGGGDETFVYASGHAGLVDLRGGVAREAAFGSISARLRLGIGLRYARYLVGVAREDGTSGLGASYQFMLSTVFDR